MTLKKFYYYDGDYTDLEKLVSYVNNYILKNSSLNELNKYNDHFVFDTVFIITQPKKQKHFNFCNINTNFHKNISAGQIMCGVLHKSKFFKRHKKNIVPVSIILKNYFHKLLSKNTILIVKNFTPSHYNLLKVLYKYIHININKILLKKAYNQIKTTVRRIKKKNFKNLLKT